MQGILSGWPEQYHRMRRSLDHLAAIAEGRLLGVCSDEARDALFHFFQDAFHLKDWIKNDGASSVLQHAVEHELFCNGLQSRCSGHDRAPLVMRLCADLCNGTKHLALTGGRVAGAVTGQHVTVRPAAAGTDLAPDPPLHAWTVEGDHHQYDAVRLAREVVTEWDRWLASQMLDAERGR